MLHFETVLAGTLDLLRRIQAMRLAADMRLVGGTALALHIGHRKSVDLDLFGSFGEQASFRAELLKDGHVADDAEDDPMPEMLVPVTWKGVKDKIESTVRDFVRGL